MLTMTQLHDIRNHYFVEGKNIAQISRETKNDRKTIRNAIKREDWNEEPPKLAKDPEFPKLEPYKKEIDEWLTEDKKAKKKQRHTAKRVYSRLNDKYNPEFDCSYRTVAGYVRIKKREIYRSEPGFLPLEHIPGEAQVDFGAADYYENGQLVSGKYLNLSFPHSNKGYLQLFKGENQECLFEGLISIFEHIGGVPHRIWFDNASTMVTQILKDGNRTLTQDFVKFVEHYRFVYAFCNANAGHEKGNIEGKVGYHRRNLLVPVPRFESLAKYNAELFQQCEDDSHRDHYRKDSSIDVLYTQDKVALLDLPNVPLDVSKYQPVSTNGYGRFYLYKGLHEYSVSPKYSNCKVIVKITANHIIPMDENYREIVRHERFYGDYKQQSMKWLPYLTQLSRCPGALKYTGIYQMLPETLKQYLEKCIKSDKGKILKVIAKLTERNGFESAVNTVDNALKYDAIDEDSLVSLHNRLYSNVIELAPLRLSMNIPNLTRVTPDFAAYDASLSKAGMQNVK